MLRLAEVRVTWLVVRLMAQPDYATCTGNTVRGSCPCQPDSSLPGCPRADAGAFGIPTMPLLLNAPLDQATPFDRRSTPRLHLFGPCQSCIVTSCKTIASSAMLRLFLFHTGTRFPVSQ